MSQTKLPYKAGGGEENCVLHSEGRKTEGWAENVVDYKSIFSSAKGIVWGVQGGGAAPGAKF